MTFATARRGAFLAAAALLAALQLAACSGSKEAAPALQRLDLTPPTPSLPRGAALQLRATALWTSGAPQDVGAVATWTSSNPAVATVAGGLVTGVEPGSATVTASWSGQSAAVAVTVTPAALVALAVDPPAAALPAGTRRAFTATGTYSDGTTRDLTASAAWATSAGAVLELPAGAAPGEVRGLAAGAATLTATQDGHQASAAISVTAPALVELRVEPPAASVPVGLATAFTATGVYSDGSTAPLTAEVLWAAEGGLAVFPDGEPAGTARALAVGGPGLIHALLPGSAVAGHAALTVTDAVPVSLDVSPGAATLAAGLSRAFVASAVFSDGQHADVTGQAAWSSSAPAVAAVSTAPATAGQVSALAAGGPVTITAALPGSGVSGTATLTVAAAAVAAIDVAPPTAAVAAGRTQPFTAEAVLTDGRRLPATDDATWTSSDPGLAPVSNAAGSRGVATGLRAGGPVTISARLPGVAPGGAAALTVEPAALVGLAVEPAELSLAAGTGGRLLATGLFSDGTRADLTGAVTWTSAAPATAAVGTGPGGAGVVSALQAGAPVVVTAALPGGGPSATATVTVTPAVLLRLALTPASATVPLGVSAAYLATGTFSDGRQQDLTAQVSWLSSDVAVATVSNALASAGVAQSRGEGTAELVAWFPGTAISAAATLTVTPPALLALAVSPGAATIPAGRLQQFTAAGTYTDGVVRDVTAAATWASGAPSLAALTAVPGQLRGVAPGGPVAVTAALDGITGAASLTIAPAVLERVTVSPAVATLSFGEAVDLTAEGGFSDGTRRDVTAEAAWSASPAGVVRLQPAAGAERATGIGIGQAQVSATVGEVTGTAGLAVAPVLPLSLVVAPGAASVELGNVVQLRALATFPGGAVLDVTEAATWTSSSPERALPTTPAGLVLGLAPGSATVTASYGASGSASVNVTEAPVVPVLDTLVVSGTTPPLGVGGVAQLAAGGVFSDGHQEDLTAQVAWASSDAAVATVGAGGLVRGVGPGSVTVTATHAASGVSGQAPLAVLPDAPVDAVVVRVAPRVVAGQQVPAAAIGLLAGGGEVDLTAAVQWVGLTGAEHAGGGRFVVSGARGRLAAVWGDQVVTAEVEVVPLRAASSYQVLPGDAVIPALTQGSGGPDGGGFPLATFAAVLTFDDAWPRQVVAGTCTSDPDFMQCAQSFFFGSVEPGCELTCTGSQGVSLCAPLAPVTRTIECVADGLVAQATATVVEGTVSPTLAGLLVRPAGWAAQAHTLNIDTGSGTVLLDFGAPPLPRLHPGDLTALEAVALRSDATFDAVPAAWTSADPRVASLEGPGQVRARAAGATVVQARAETQTALADVEVLPSLRAGPFVVSGPDAMLVGAEPARFTATMTGPEGGDVTASLAWTSSDPAVAAFDAAAPGQLLGLAPGVVTITAASRQGQVASRQVTVVGLVGLEVYPAHARIGFQGEFAPMAVAVLSDGRRLDATMVVTWRVTDGSVLWEVAPGLFMPGNVGSTLISADLFGLQGIGQVDVLDPPPAPALDAILVLGLPDLAVGGLARPTVRAIFDDGSVAVPDASYAYATGDAAVAATVPGDPGALVGVGAGQTTFTVTDPGGTISGSGPVSVYELASLQLTPASLTLAVGEAAAVEVSGVDTAGQRHLLPDAQVTSSAPQVASWSSGFVAALAEGSATLTAAVSGVSATAEVTVVAPAPLQLWLEPQPLVLELGARYQVRATAMLTDGSTVDVTAQAAWRTLDASVVTLPAGQPGGTIEGVAPGDGAVAASFTAGGRTVTTIAGVRIIPPVDQLLLVAEPASIPAGFDSTVRAGVMLPDGSIVELTSTVTFASSDPAVAAHLIGPPNVFTGLQAGLVTITGTTPGGSSGTTQLEVLPAEPMALAVAPARVDGAVGAEAVFRATALYSDGREVDVTDQASWFVDGPVDQVGPGRFVPRSGGSFPVSATLAGRFDMLGADALLEVPHAWLSLEVQLLSPPPLVGDTATFGAVALRDDLVQLDVTDQVTWSVDRADAAPGASPGQLRFDGSGRYLVTATMPDGTAGQAAVDVLAAPVSLTLTPASASGIPGQLLFYTAEVLFSDGTTGDVTNDPATSWNVVDWSVAAPWGPGAVAVQGYGTTEVVVTFDLLGRVVEGRASVTGVPYQLAVRMTPPAAAVAVGGSVAFSLVAEMSNGDLVDRTAEATWLSLDGAVARVDAPGLVTGLAEGTAQIWATLPDDARVYQATLDVLPAAIP